jgi:hypothetical protein
MPAKDGPSENIGRNVINLTVLQGFNNAASTKCFQVDPCSRNKTLTMFSACCKFVYVRVCVMVCVCVCIAYVSYVTGVCRVTDRSTCSLTDVSIVFT